MHYLRLFLLVLISCYSQSSYSQLSGLFTINKNQPASSTNFASINDAVDSLELHGVSGPVTITVVAGSGPYQEQVTIGSIPGASGTNRITIDGNNDTIRFNPASVSSKHILFLNGSDYITIKNFVFDGQWYSIGIRLASQANYNIIDNNVFDYRNIWMGYPIVVSSCPSFPSTTCATTANNNTISNNKLYGGTDGIFLIGSFGSYLNSNVVENNIIEDFDRYSIYLSGGQNCHIKNNDISRPTRTSSSIFYGIGLSFFSIGNQIHSNKIHNTHGSILNNSENAYGIHCNSNNASNGNPNLIFNNLIFDIETTGHVYGIFLVATGYIRAFYNTIVINDSISNSGDARGWHYDGGSMGSNGSGLFFYNNIVHINKNGTGTKTCISNQSAPFLTSNYNALYVSGSGSGAKYIGQNGAYSYSNLTQWQNAINKYFDTNSVSTNTLFRDLQNWNLIPNDTNCNNIGSPYFTSVDAYGQTRNSINPDPGAIEFEPIIYDANFKSFVRSYIPCLNYTPIELIVQNAGLSTINSLKVYFQKNNDPIDSLILTSSILSSESDTLLLDSLLISDSTIIKAWVGEINGQLDENHENDTSYSHLYFPPLSGIYTINKSLPTTSINFQSFESAVHALKVRGICSAVVFNVDSNIYNEHISLDEILGSSQVNTVTFKGNGSTIQFTTTASINSILELKGTDYFSFEKIHFLISPSATGGWGIHLWSGANNNRIEDCRLTINTGATNNSFNGIVASNDKSLFDVQTSANHNQFLNNIIVGGWNGIRLNGGPLYTNTGNVIKGNIIENNLYAIFINFSDSCVIDSNDISRPNNVNSRDFYGITLSSNCTSTLVTRNKIHDPNGNAIQSVGNIAQTRAIVLDTYIVPSGKENKVYNNLIYNMNSNWSHTFGVYIGGSWGCRIHHNTIVLDHSPIDPGYQKGIFFFSGGAQNIQISNNLIYLANGNGGNARGLDLQNVIDVCDNNNIYLDTNSISGQADFAVLQFSYYHRLTDWQAANSGAYGQSSTDLDPYFRNPVQNNYIPSNIILKNSCPQIASIDKDINAAPRDTLTDPGAHLIQPFSDDAGISIIYGPEFSCDSNRTFSVQLNNYAVDVLNSVEIFWQIDSVIYDSTLNSLALMPGDSIDILLDSFVLFSQVNLRAWTSNPNGVVDERFSNDTSSFTVDFGMAGNYYVNKFGSINDTSYITLNSFVSDLKTRGMCGPIDLYFTTSSTSYIEQIEFKNISGNSSANYLHIHGNGNTLNYNIASSSLPFFIHISNMESVTIDSLNITVGSSISKNWAVWISDSSQNISIENCSISLPSNYSYDNSFVGLFIGDSSGIDTTSNIQNVTINNCVIIGGNNSISTGNDTIFSANSMHILSNTLKEFYSHGIFANGISDVVIAQNNIFRSNLQNCGNFQGIELNNCLGPIQVSKNTIHNSHTSANQSSKTTESGAIKLSSCSSTSSPIYISNNLIYNIDNKGQIAALKIDSCQNIKALYNTISLDAIILSQDEISGIELIGALQGCEIKNNIISIERGSNSVIQGIKLSDSSSQVAIDFNNVFIGGVGNGQFFYANVEGKSIASLTSWQNSFGSKYGASSKSNTPAYNYFLNNFVPSNSAINGIADPSLAILTDFNNVNRDSINPDPGAFEFSPLSHDLATSGVILNEINKCGDSLQILKVVIENFGSSQEDSIPVFLSFSIGSVIDTLFSLIDSISSSTQDTIEFGPVNLFNGGLLRLFSGFILSSDINHSNDTLSQSIVVNPSPYKPNLTDTTVCSAMPSQINLVPKNWTYYWFSSDTISSNFNTGNHFTMPVLNQDTLIYIQSTYPNTLCQSVRVPFLIKKDDLSAFFTYSIKNQNEVEFINGSKGLIASFHWDFDDGNTSIDTNPVNIYAANGIYLVELETKGVCDTLIYLDTIEIKYVSTPQITESDNLYIRPNPSNGSVFIKIDSDKALIVNLTVTTTTGSIVYQESQFELKESWSIINLNGLSEGIYILQLSTTNTIYKKKLIIK